MKKILLLIITVQFSYFLYAQCTAPTYNVDLSAKTDTSWVLADASRGGNCCGSSNCITFNVTINEGTELISFDVTNPSPSGSAFYQVNCGAPVSIGTPLCVIGLESPFTITYCKPGGDRPDYLINAGTVVHASGDISIRIVGCTDTLSVENVDIASVEWTSIYPGAEGDYNSYLSCTSGCNTTLVTPTQDAPTYVDFQVSGDPSTSCGGYSRDTVRVFFVPHLTATIDPPTAVICASSGDIVTLTAIPDGGAIPYHYSWSTGPHSQSINTNSSGTYTVTISDNTNCPEIEFTKVIGNIPSATFTFSDVSFCKNEANPTPLFYDNGEPGNFSVTPAGLVFVSTATGEIDLPASTAGTYTVTNTIASSGTCPGASHITTVTINPFPEMTSAASASICSGSLVDIPLTSTSSATYTWVAIDNLNITGESLTLESTSNLSNTLVNLSGSDEIVSYTVIPTSTLTGLCQGTTQTVDVTVHPMDDAGFTYSSSTNCQTGTNPTTTITGLPGGTFSSTAGLAFVSTSTGEVDLLGSTVGSYMVTYTTNGTCPNTQDFPINITVAPSSAFSYTGDPYCQDLSNPFPTFDPGAGGGIFTSDPGLVFVSDLTGQVNLSGSTPGTYSVTNTIPASGGCAASVSIASITITRHELATFSYTETPYCTNEANPLPVLIGDALAGSFTSDPGLSIIPGTGEVDLILSTPGTYTVSNTLVAAGGCPEHIETSEITITALPVSTFSYSGSPYCSDGSDVSPTLDPGSVTGLFSASSVFLDLDNVTGDISIMNSLPGTFNVTNTIAAANGCPLVSSVAPIVITELPKAGLSYLDTPYCMDGTDPTPEIVIGGSNGNFTAIPAGLVMEPESGTIDLLLSNAGTYTVTNKIAAEAGCAEVSESTSVTLTELPTASILYAGTPYCNSVTTAEGVSLTGNTGGEYTALPAGLDIDINTGEITPSSSLAGTYTVTYRIAAADGCGEVTTNTSVTITALPAATIAYLTDSVCNTASDENVNFAGITGGVFSAPAGLSIDPVSGTITPATSLPDTYTVTYTIAAADGCAEVSATSDFTIHEMPVASSFSSGILCKSGSTDVIITASGGVAPYTGTGTFQETAGTYNYVIADMYGCSAQTSITLSEPDTLIASSIATPILCNSDTSLVTISATGGTGLYSGTGVFQAVAGNHTYYVSDENGCIDSSLISIAQPDTLIALSLATQIMCHSDSATVTVSATGGTGLYTGTGTFLLPAGDYSFTVTDENGCTAETSITISEPDTLIAASSATEIMCYGDTSLVTITATGGTGLYTGTGIDSVIAGSYTYYVTDENGCTDSTLILISEPDTLIASSTATAILCNGGTAEVTVSASGGTGAYTGTGVYTVTAGTYTYTVTDENNCTATTTITVSEPTSITATVSTTLAGCGLSDGIATVTATGGTGTLTYLWNPEGGTNAVSTGLPAGTFTVLVQDANACSATYIANISNSGAPVVATSQTDLVCNGVNSGAIDLTVTGGTGAYTFNWNSGQFSTEDLSGLYAGTYNFNVTDEANCQANGSITITEPDTLIAFSSATPILCHSDSAIVTVTATGGTGIISGIGTFAVAAGTYSYTVTDENGCMAVTNILVTEPDTLVSSSTSTEIMCYGDSSIVTISAIGGTGIYSGIFEDTVAAGSYTYYITDENGCTDSTTININQPDTLVAFSTSTDILCKGDSSIVTVTATGGTGVYAGTGMFTVAAGDHSFTVTDDNGCSSITLISISEPTALEATIEAGLAGCDLSDGIAVVSAYGGTGALAYTWSPAGGNDSTTTGLPAGQYYVEIEDANGCILNDSVIIENNIPPTSTATNTDVLCNGMSTGAIDLTVIGGTAPFSYSWNSNTYITEDLDSIASGTYNYVVTDSANCQTTGSVYVSEPSILSSVITETTPPLCFESSEGQAVVLASGGTTPYFYEWNDNAGTLNDTVTGLPGNATYFVTITDAHGCTAVDSATVVAPTMLSLTGSSSEAYCNTSSGSAFVSATGGTMPYSFIWDDLSASVTDTIQSLIAGNYSATVTDANGCTSVFTATVNDIPGGAIQVDQTDNVLCYGASNGSLTISMIGGTAPYSYLWQHDNTNLSNVAANLASGTYLVTVTDANSCTADTAITISQPSAPLKANLDIEDVSCFGYSDGSITAIPEGGTQPYSFSWSTGHSNSYLSGLTAGNYFLTITDSNDCLFELSGEVQQPAIIQVTDTVIIEEDNTGTIDLTVSGGIMPYSFLWSNDETTEDLAALENGDYTVSITDMNSCIATDSITVKVHNLVLDIPSAITPNGDGKNDDFAIRNIEYYANVTIQVFNRWGNQLFQFSGSGYEYANTSERWDGTYNGKELPLGGYVYIVTVGGIEETFDGIVTIIR